MDFDVEVINRGTDFIHNEAQRGAALYMLGRVHSINTDCDFLDNYAVLNGGTMYIWDGVNCSNINCNFIQNVGMYDFVYFGNSTTKCLMQSYYRQPPAGNVSL